MSSDSSALILSSFRKVPSSTLQNGMSGTQADSTFLMTVVRVTRLKDWNTMPMPRRKRRRLLPDSVLTSVSFTVSGAGASDNGHELAVLNGQVHVVQAHRSVGVYLGYMVENDHTVSSFREIKTRGGQRKV